MKLQSSYKYDIVYIKDGIQLVWANDVCITTRRGHGWEKQEEQQATPQHCSGKEKGFHFRITKTNYLTLSTL
jgi:hypothetical protein